VPRRLFTGHHWAPSKSVVEQNRRSGNCHSPYGSDGRTAGSRISRSSRARFRGRKGRSGILRKSAIEEKAHARVLSAMVPPVNPRTALDKILKRERWHGRGGSWVADAIYGANDGLGAVFGIVSGVAGATNNQQHYVLISGLAGMLASTLSMGAGAYLAAKSEAEVYEAEISRERARWKRILKKKSKKCRSSISCRDSLLKNRRKWRSAWRNNPSNSCR
jgi:Uncharacterized membrane protein